MSKIWCLLIPGFNPVLLQMANKIPFFPISHSYEGFSYKLVKISFSLGLLSTSTEVERRPPPSQSLPRLSWSPCFSPVLNAFLHVHRVPKCSAHNCSCIDLYMVSSLLQACKLLRIKIIIYTYYLCLAVLSREYQYRQICKSY